MPLSEEVFTKISAVASEVFFTFINSIFAPICLNACRKPILVSLIPTFFIFIEESGQIRAARIKKDAEEKSPGTFISWG